MHARALYRGGNHVRTTGRGERGRGNERKTGARTGAATEMRMLAETGTGTRTGMGTGTVAETGTGTRSRGDGRKRRALVTTTSRNN